MLQLNCSCPFCNRSLMDQQHPIAGAPSVFLQGKLRDNENNTEGFIRLSAFYGDFTIETTLMIPDGALVDFQCPFCHADLSSSHLCEDCNAPIVALQLNIGGKVQFCARRSCQKHSLELNNPQEDLAAFYKEYSPSQENER